MKNIKALILAMALAMAIPASAETNSPPATNSVPTVTGALNNLFSALSYDKTNWLFEAHAMYASALQGKWGGGLGGFYPISQYVFAGARVDWVDGGFWMPSGNAGLQLPIHPFSWLKVTPFGYAGIGIPLSGALVGDFKVPGSLRDNNGQATAILGYGLAVHLFTTKDGKYSLSLVGDRENWSGFAGQQYRMGILFHMLF